ncbi:hypothetical protein [Roseibium sp. MMSF_3412]|uniref:hypothetical protein n=1 Tax=Roseibium sp. MMSF_3412 TaxID=3046712 RepID=UPI00273D11C1|nr:hypothetical protein [Roseibium sp. MMSF_3412]
MLEPQAPKTTREIVRDTFTPSRVGILSWALAAVFMGTIGLASYQFGSRPFAPFPAGQALPSGVTLAAGDPIETTASINAPAPVAIAKVSSQGSGSDQNLQQSQIEVLQREVVGLRRRLAALTEQNLIYSSRIAALEQEAALAKLAATERAKTRALQPIAPRPGKVVTDRSGAAAAVNSVRDMPVAKQETPPQTRTSSLSAPSSQPVVASAPGMETSEEAPGVRLLPPPQTIPAPENAESEPVRIISPAADDTSSLTTASIPDEPADVEAFNANPTTTTLAPRVISPSAPSGQIRGTGRDSQIRRSDFGAVIGHYRTRASAAKAWADFKEQNEERMRDLRPLLMEKQTEEGGIALMIGPFANAADASIACLHLLDVTELCRPALYAGDPLVTAAEFRETGF